MKKFLDDIRDRRQARREPRETSQQQQQQQAGPSQQQPPPQLSQQQQAGSSLLPPQLPQLPKFPALSLHLGSPAGSQHSQQTTDVNTYPTATVATTQNGESVYPAKKEHHPTEEDKDITDDRGFFVNQEKQNDSFYQKDEEGKRKLEANLVYKSNADLLVSTKFDLAIESSTAEAKFFFATEERLNEANEALQGKIKLKKTNKYLSIERDGKTTELYQIEPYVPEKQETINDRGSGLEMRTPQPCDKMAEFVTGNNGIQHTGGKEAYKKLAKVLDRVTGEDFSALEQQLSGEKKPDTKLSKNKKLGKKPEIKILDAKKLDETSNNNDSYKKLLDYMSDRYRRENRKNADRVNAALKAEKANQYIDPNIGNAVTTYGVYTEEEEKNMIRGYSADYHYGSVVAKSGSDYITLENYARHNESNSGSDPLFYFKMYTREETWHATQQELRVATGQLVGAVISFTVS